MGYANYLLIMVHETMKLVYKFNIKSNKMICDMCKLSKNLYNQALYLVKTELLSNNTWLTYSDLDRIMKRTYSLDGSITYRQLKSQVSQQCLRSLESNIKSYIKAVKDFARNRIKYNGRPNLPRYKKGLNQIVYTNQSCTIKEDGYIHLDKQAKIKIPQFNKYKNRLANFTQIRITPKINKTFSVEIIYDSNHEYGIQLNNDAYSSIDLGVNNLATMILPNNKPLIFNGKQLKAKNQYFNKRVKKIKAKLGTERKTSKKLQYLCAKNANQESDIFHKLSRIVINKLIENKIGNLVVGYNKGWKDSINIGHRNNQTFTKISHEKLINNLKYKCKIYGINFILTDESYTSKCDGLAMENVCKHTTYLGKRIKRGLFQSSTGKLINADVNGSLNIMRKVVGDSETISKIINSGWLFQPVKVNLL